MRVLFVHQNFPGQYKHLAATLASDPSHRVVAIGEGDNLKRQQQPHGVQLVGYVRQQQVAKETHPYLRDLDGAVGRGQLVARVAQGLKKQGFVPDLICCHPGWGEGLFLKDIWPESPMLGFFEFFYHPMGSDLGFDPEFPALLDDRMRVRIKNTVNLLSLDACDRGVSPTRWQWSRYPSVWRDRISVVFDGVDTRSVKPDPRARVAFPGGGIGKVGDEIVTFVNRNLEPYRGFHRFMRALPGILEQRPRARVVIVGGDGVSYGRRLAQGSYREHYLAELGERLDRSRVHFVGRVPYQTLIGLFQVSAAHVYLTYPFVLSWSMLEAMSAGCLVVGSRTPPVEEMIRDGENGILVDFFDTEGLVSAVVDALEHPGDYAALRLAARARVEQEYDLQAVCLPRHLDLLKRLASGEGP